MSSRRPVFAHTTPSDGNAQALRIELSAEDVDRWQTVLDREVGNGRAGQNNVGPWVMGVTDLNTGERWDLRSYPCGTGCRCAAQLRPHGSTEESR